MNYLLDILSQVNHGGGIVEFRQKSHGFVDVQRFETPLRGHIACIMRKLLYKFDVNPIICYWFNQVNMRNNIAYSSKNQNNDRMRQWYALTSQYDSRRSDIPIRFSAMSVKTWKWPKSVMKKRYGDTNIHSMWESCSRWPLRAASQPSVGLKSNDRMRVINISTGKHDYQLICEFSRRKFKKSWETQVAHWVEHEHCNCNRNRALVTCCIKVQPTF